MQLFTISEAAATLGITEKAIRRRIEQGSIASIRRGNRRLVPQVEVDRVRDEIDFPTDLGDEGKGQTSAGNAGNPTTVLVEQLGRAVEIVRDETERRVNAERDRDAAIERELSERQSREVAEGEIFALRARIVELETVTNEAEPITDASSTESQGRAWRRLFASGTPRKG